jgi:DNA polymerase-3 subunit gamma/tau
MLGARPFYAEIAAGAAAFQRGPQGKTVFIRAVRRLLARFSPDLWEQDAHFNKVSALRGAVEEDIDAINRAKTEAALKKQIEAARKNALKLESEGMAELIPIAQIRRAAAWSHLAPFGRRKFMLLENADRMQEGARNALLKLLEEPPASLTITLTTARPGALLETIRSRLRPYRFVQRSAALESQLIQRLFDEQSDKSLGEYLDSFMPVSAEALRGLAAFLGASIAYRTAQILRRGSADLPDELVAFGKISAPIAEKAGLGRPEADIKTLTAVIMEHAAGFEPRSLFQRFLASLLSLVSQSAAESCGGGPNLGRDMWRVRAGEAAAAVGTYNQSPALALERLASAVPRDFARQFGA